MNECPQRSFDCTFCLIQKVVKRGYFSLKLQISCHSFIEWANFLLWMRPIKHLLFTDELKMRPFPTALSKLYFMQFRSLSINSMKSHACSPVFAKSQGNRVGKFRMCPVLILKCWLPVVEPLVRAFLAVLR